MDKYMLLKKVIEKVPAYRKFSIENKINCNTKWEDIPFTTKENYLLKYKLEELCWNGELDKAHLIGSSSGFGSSGSIFWPKRPEDEKDYLKNVENFLIKIYQINNKNTLILVCLAFGTWIGGMQIASTIRYLSVTNKYKIICSTPGLNLIEAVEIYKLVEKHIDQTLIITNPSNIPLIKALMDRNGINYKNGNIFFPVVGEYFSERMRIKIAEDFGHEKDYQFSIWTGFGSADTGDIGIETEATINLRKYFFKNPELSEKIFGTKDTPMIFELSPKPYIEIVNKEIIVTKDQIVPLIRYNTKDRGGLLYTDKIKNIVPENLLNSLPEKMLYVYGRTSDSIIFYGTNLSIGEIQNFLLGLDKSYNYGGLYQVQTQNVEGIQIFTFLIYTTKDYKSTQLKEKYKSALLDFLFEDSNEFKFKYNHLYSIVGERLIEVKLKDIKSYNARLKHKFIVEVS